MGSELISNYQGYLSSILIISSTFLAVAPIFYSFTRRDGKPILVVSVFLLISFVLGLVTVTATIDWLTAAYAIRLPFRPFVFPMPVIIVLGAGQVYSFTVGAISYWVYSIHVDRYRLRKRKRNDKKEIIKTTS